MMSAGFLLIPAIKIEKSGLVFAPRIVFVGALGTGLLLR